MTQNPQSQSIIVTFAKPVPPGTTFSIVLQTVQNPSLAGTYLFRVQAFPSGPEPVGFDLGVGRFTFYPLSIPAFCARIGSRRNQLLV